MKDVKDLAAGDSVKCIDDCGVEKSLSKDKVYLIKWIGPGKHYQEDRFVELYEAGPKEGSTTWPIYGVRRFEHFIRPKEEKMIDFLYDNFFNPQEKDPHPSE